MISNIAEAISHFKNEKAMTEKEMSATNLTDDTTGYCKGVVDMCEEVIEILKRLEQK